MSSESSGGLASTSNAFIFSLRNSKGLGPFKSLVRDSSRAIYRSSGSGPAFSGASDIVIADQANNNTKSHTLYSSHLMTGKSFTLPNNTFKEYHCPHKCLTTLTQRCLCKQINYILISFKIWSNRAWCKWRIKLLGWSQEQHAHSSHCRMNSFLFLTLSKVSREPL